jgi:hypothetical protein
MDVHMCCEQSEQRMATRVTGLAALVVVASMVATSSGCGRPASTPRPAATTVTSAPLPPDLVRIEAVVVGLQPDGVASICTGGMPADGSQPGGCTHIRVEGIDFDKDGIEPIGGGKRAAWYGTLVGHYEAARSTFVATQLVAGPYFSAPPAVASDELRPKVNVPPSKCPDEPQMSPEDMYINFRYATVHESIPPRIFFASVGAIGSLRLGDAELQWLCSQHIDPAKVTIREFLLPA